MTNTENSQNRLSIQLTLDGFSFLVYAPNQLKIIAEKEFWHDGKTPYYDWLKVKLAAETILQKKYAIRKVLYVPNKSTVLPTTFVDDSNVKAVFETAHPLQEDEILFTEAVQENTEIYAIPEVIYNLVKDYLQRTPKWTTLFSHLRKNIASKKMWNVSICVLQNKLTVLVMKNEKLQLHNTFSFQTKDDLLFYMLYLFDSFDIPVAESSIQLWGRQDYFSLLSEELSRYHNDIQIPTQTYTTKSKISFVGLLLSNN